jgi:hypothetical protein
MISNMRGRTIYGVAFALPAVTLLVLLSSCAEQTGQTQAEYANPGRPEVYSAQERGYEKPWPFGDQGSN